jgi:hypothetical protein
MKHMNMTLNHNQEQMEQIHNTQLLIIGYRWFECFEIEV